LDRSLFLHVRRGDYTSEAHNIHLVDLKLYCSRALELANKKLPPGWKLYVFSDDLDYCRSEIEFGDVEPHYVEDLDEVASLVLMANCRLGGICSDSTFSWWGSYLIANPSKLVTFPSVWWNRKDIDYSRVFYAGSTVIEVE
jgi:hypothetical protein